MEFKPSTGKPAGTEFTHKGPDSTFAAQTVTGPAIYHFGIIDFLQNWTLQKRIERAFKIYFFRKDPDGLSVMNPIDYKLRFQGKVDQIFDLEGKAGGIGSAVENASKGSNSKGNSVTVDTSKTNEEVELTSIYPRNSYNARKDKHTDTSVYNPMNEEDL